MQGADPSSFPSTRGLRENGAEIFLPCMRGAVVTCAFLKDNFCDVIYLWRLRMDCPELWYCNILVLRQMVLINSLAKAALSFVHCASITERAPRKLSSTPWHFPSPTASVAALVGLATPNAKRLVFLKANELNASAPREASKSKEISAFFFER